MILTLFVPGTSVRKVGESLSIYIPVYSGGAAQSSISSNDSQVKVNDGGNRGSNADSMQRDDADQTGKRGSGSKARKGGKRDGGSDAGNKNVKRFQSGPIRSTASVKKISSVLVFGRVSLTMPVIVFLAQHHIPVIIIDKNHPVAVINPYAVHGSVKVRKEQFKALENEKGFYLAKQIVFGALENKARFLLLLAKNRVKRDASTAAYLKRAAEKIRRNIDKLDRLTHSNTYSKDRYILMGIEGDGSRIYIDAIKHVIPSGYNFSGRARRPPPDEINSLLSLGYVVLQGFVTMGVAAVGLEPYAGVLHADRSGKPSMVLDMMEEFRQPIVDRLVLTLVTRRVIKPQHFQKTTSGIRLTDKGKEIYLSRLVRRAGPLLPEELERMTEKNYYRDIIRQARGLSRFLLGLKSSYEPYIMDW
ncbi:MAG: CRISPR-associated endonuclease Cas1 [Promethearchaeota archaeon]